ncbi:FAD/NAD(P)-binding domain-containing protein [Wallemia mellicola]|uniref:FAD/NAD(P)-binding domain-containing protein n=1 Tax=Wallemia mellicola TaxID=1708541 RepID=A0A4T0NKY1_9BASI|nr:FAD/NAD(P)-binding domain-containing protein [Wallemia mellicola]
MNTAPRVAIIGAGQGGLVSANEVKKRVPDAEIVVFEVRNNVGGVWNLGDTPKNYEIRFDDFGQAHAATSFSHYSEGVVDVKEEVPPSAIYGSLRTNLPTELMSFRNDEHLESTHRFPSHTEILKYLERFAKKYGLTKLIQLGTRVLRLKHADGVAKYKYGYLPQQKGRWEITLENVNTKQQAIEWYDFVINASGHYVQAHIPFIDNLWKFEGDLFHSRFYESAEQFRGKSCVVIGSRASGYDISREIAWLDCSPEHGQSPYNSVKENPGLPSTRIIQSRRSPPKYEWKEERPRWLDKIEQRGEVVGTHGRSVIYADGHVDHGIDVIIFGTGYTYTYPFMRPTDEPWKSNSVFPQSNQSRKNVLDDIPAHLRLPYNLPDSAQGSMTLVNLSKHNLFYLSDPSYAFVGLLRHVHPFALSEAQAHVIAFVLSLKERMIPSVLLQESYEADQFWTFPTEFEMTDEMLLAINEGEDYHIEKENVWSWYRTPQWVLKLAESASKDKRLLLGY